MHDVTTASIRIAIVPSDSLEEALTEAGFDPPTAATRENFWELCLAFSQGDSEIINSILNGGQRLVDIVTVAFGVLCPENVQHLRSL